ncbi:NADPH-dependent F420 reductase [Microbacterium sp. ASV49]|uniref:NADPH-dependent F420 reductase n=1 Tax=Microbacterium candidum TaxID=3041922 RepID=A0ABT7MVI6_9MICO|nr:NADPH-dependent F420 reductase [Microbacterium sp. ASV49]MDL9978470.1 NADPH-dependent F420 reductase [Microbacterium sp. ASV49]
MSKVTVIGAGNMGSAIAGIAAKGGADVQIVGRDERAAQLAAQIGGTAATTGDALTGDVVVLAVPYPALAELAATYGAQLDGKVVVDISNPVDFETFDGLVVPADGSAAAELAALLPGSKIVKAFNTNFAASLATGELGDVPTRVILAGDDDEAKALVRGFVEAGGVAVADAGSLKRARELEALGFLQMVLAVREQVAWTGGFAVVS